MSNDGVLRIGTYADNNNPMVAFLVVREMPTMGPACMPVDK